MQFWIIFYKNTKIFRVFFSDLKRNIFSFWSFMVSRRQTLKVVISSLFAPAIGGSSIASAMGAILPSRVVDPACPSCAASERMTAVFANILDSAPLLKHVSLPSILRPAAPVGAPVPYVESATGNLMFSIHDLELHGLPELVFYRIYNSANLVDNGMGAGWSIGLDDRIVVLENVANLFTARGENIRLLANSDGSGFSSGPQGLNSRRNISWRDDSTLIEHISPKVTRTYTKIVDNYYLTGYEIANIGSVRIERDAAGRMLSLANRAAGMLITLAWSNQGQLMGLSDSAGRKVHYNYVNGFLAGHQDVVGSTWHYTYSDARLVSVTDPLMTVLLSVNYADGRTASVTTIGGHQAYAYAMLRNGAVSAFTVTDGNGRSDEYLHNDDGSVVSARTAGSSASDVDLRYDETGNLTGLASSAGEQTYAYDHAGRMIHSNNGKYTRQWAYREDGLLEAATDASGVTLFDYDAAGNLVGARGPRALRSYTLAHANGRLAKINGGRHAHSFTYNAQGKISTVGNQNNKSAIQFGYDGAGFLILEKMRNSYSATAKRNARGQLIDWSDSHGRQFTFQRDARGAVTQITNTNGDWARASRDSAGRVVRLNNSQGQTRTFAYGTDGTLDYWTDSLGRTFSVKYDLSSGKANQMVQLNGNVLIVRGKNGEAVVATALASLANGVAADNGSPLSDGWSDPLYGHGLLGSFSGFTKYAAMETARMPASSVPPALAAMLIAGESDTSGDDDGVIGYDPSDDTPPDDDFDDAPPEDDGGGTPGGLPPGSIGGGGSGGHPQCSPCQSAYQIACDSSYNDAYSSAVLLNASANLTCLALAETGPVALLCAIAAELVYISQTNTADTNHTNCLNLIPQTCYSQCN